MVTAQEEEGMRAEGRRWGNEASVPDEAWEGLGRGADFLEREGENLALGLMLPLGSCPAFVVPAAVTGADPT